MVKVITYGSYDMLHYGHIRLLERAKALSSSASPTTTQLIILNLATLPKSKSLATMQNGFLRKSFLEQKPMEVPTTSL